MWSVVIKEMRNMKISHPFTASLLFAALLLAGCGQQKALTPAVPEGASAGDLTGLAKCNYQPAGSKTTYAAECGTLTVPENWGKAGSRLIALPVVRIPSAGPRPSEPVFYLQ